jgi:DNA-binding MurR/RpiR family transcriptional regulator
MMRAAGAVREALEQLDTTAVGAAIAIFAESRRIDIYGQGGGSAVVAEDAKLRLFRLGIPVAAFIDGHQQRMSAATLRPGDAVLAVSNSGRSKPVVEAVSIARSFGAATVALTRPGTPLARAAEIVIPVVIAEGEDILVPTPSRYAHLAIIDTLATGVAARLGAAGREALRRVRYTVASIGIAIPTPSTDPTPLMKSFEPQE